MKTPVGVFSNSNKEIADTDEIGVELVEYIMNDEGQPSMAGRNINLDVTAGNILQEGSRRITGKRPT